MHRTCHRRIPKCNKSLASLFRERLFGLGRTRCKIVPPKVVRSNPSGTCNGGDEGKPFGKALETHCNDDNSHYQHDHNNNTEKGRQSSSRKKERKKEHDSETCFDVSRCLNSGNRFDELQEELEGCKWDAVLLCETWRQEKEQIWESTCGHICSHTYVGAGGVAQKHGVGILLINRWKRKIIQTMYVNGTMITTTIKCDQRKIELTSVYFPTRDTRTCTSRRCTTNIEAHCNNKKTSESSRQTSTLCLDLDLTLNETTLENTQRDNPTNE